MELRKLLKNIEEIIIDLGNYLSLKPVLSWRREVSDLIGYIKKLYKGMMQSA